MDPSADQLAIEDDMGQGGSEGVDGDEGAILAKDPPPAKKSKKGKKAIKPSMDGMVQEALIRPLGLTFRTLSWLVAPRPFPRVSPTNPEQINPLTQSLIWSLNHHQVHPRLL